MTHGHLCRMMRTKQFLHLIHTLQIKKKKRAEPVPISPSTPETCAHRQENHPAFENRLAVPNFPPDFGDHGLCPSIVRLSTFFFVSLTFGRPTGALLRPSLPIRQGPRFAFAEKYLLFLHFCVESLVDWVVSTRPSASNRRFAAERVWSGAVR